MILLSRETVDRTVVQQKRRKLWTQMKQNQAAAVPAVVAVAVVAAGVAGAATGVLRSAPYSFPHVQS